MRDTDVDAEAFPERGRRVGVARAIGFDVSGRCGEDHGDNAREEAGQDVSERRVGSGELEDRARGQEDARADDPVDPQQDDALRSRAC